MKFRLDLKGIVFEYEKKPMPENRFKALCWIFESALYVIALKAVIVSCGFLGLITTLFLTFMVVGMKEI